MSDFIGASPHRLAALERELARAEQAIEQERIWLRDEIGDDPVLIDTVEVLLRVEEDISRVKREAKRIVSGIAILGLLGIKPPAWWGQYEDAKKRYDKGSKVVRQVAKGGRRESRLYWQAFWAARRGTATRQQLALLKTANRDLRQTFTRERLRREAVRTRARLRAERAYARGMLTGDRGKQVAAQKNLDRKLARIRGGSARPQPMGTLATWRWRLGRSLGKHFGSTGLARSVMPRAVRGKQLFSAFRARVRGRFARAGRGAWGSIAGRVSSSRLGPWAARAGRAGRYGRGLLKVGRRALGPLAMGLDAYDAYDAIRKGDYGKAAYAGTRVVGGAMLLNPVTAPFGAALIAGSYVVEHRKKIGKALGKAGSSVKKAGKKAKKKLAKFFGF